MLGNTEAFPQGSIGLSNMPRNLLTYAIGDVHGHAAKLQKLLERCKMHRQSQGYGDMRLIFIGDYIDRGPASRQVIELLMSLEKTSSEDIVCLRGNHEVVIAEIAKGTHMALNVTVEEWLDSGGGAATLRSYGVSQASDVPTQCLEWMSSRRLFYDDGIRFFVHAGVNPDLSLEEQQERDLLWIREPFLSSTKDHGRLIVHGHTPIFSAGPELRHNRLNLDTAAGYDGPLTAAVFNDKTSNPIDFLTQSD